MNSMNSKHLQRIPPLFRDVNILVIGDVIIDHFIWGSVSRISPEAPVPVVNVGKEELLLGGSANVLRNIVSLGGRGALCGMIGEDSMGRELVRLMEKLPASSDGLVATGRPTTVKTRVVAQGQQVVRFDREETGIPSRQTLQKLLHYLEKHLAGFDAVIVSDYAKGMINEDLMIRLHSLMADIRREQKRSFPLIVDPKPSNVHRFIGATIITPNHHEAEIISGMAITDARSLSAAAGLIREQINCDSVLITRGEAGMALWQEDETMVTIPTTAKEVYDVTGAGDTVAATLALGLAAGCSTRDAAVVANFAAGIVVGKVGTACVDIRELQAALTARV